MAPPNMNTMGLKGIFAIISNCTAVGLICAMFYQSQLNMFSQQKEDRLLFREELAANREHNKRENENLVTSFKKTEEAIQSLITTLKDVKKKEGVNN